LHHNLGFMIFTNVYPRYFSGMPYGATLLLAGTIAVMLGLAFAVNRFVERPSAPIVKRFLLSSWRRA
jgi:peptidoglycan/LPS O-acetylase OafA/YrhL